MKGSLIWLTINLASIALAVVIVMLACPPVQYVCGRIRIPSRDISAEIYTTEPSTDCGGIPALWNGGKVTCKADLSCVEVGDMADIITFDGGHLVMECIQIRKGRGWFMKPQGDVLVINDRYVYRFTRL